MIAQSYAAWTPVESTADSIPRHLVDGLAREPKKVVPSRDITPGRRMVAIDPEITEWDFLTALRSILHGWGTA